MVGNFPQYGGQEDIAEIPVKEEDLKLIPTIDTAVNEQIKTEFENVKKTGNSSTGSYKENEDIFGEMKTT